ncbi:hypothetical protein NSQ82_11235 [Caldifermentibacillus hisashii]|uniref:hypothetical protein n=1 Tax=Caldifermentibacillus hisashii TaxID=996558 RepID=UPI0031B6A568
MEQNKNSTPTPATGRLVTAKSGEQYFICGKSRIKVSKHFAKEGKPFSELLEQVIQHTAGNTAS